MLLITLYAEPNKQLSVCEWVCSNAKTWIDIYVFVPFITNAYESKKGTNMTIWTTITEQFFGSTLLHSLFFRNVTPDPGMPLLNLCNKCHVQPFIAYVFSHFSFNLNGIFDEKHAANWLRPSQGNESIIRSQQLKRQQKNTNCVYVLEYELASHEWPLLDVKTMIYLH